MTDYSVRREQGRGKRDSVPRAVEPHAGALAAGGVNGFVEVALAPNLASALLDAPTSDESAARAAVAMADGDAAGLFERLPDAGGVTTGEPCPAAPLPLRHLLALVKAGDGAFLFPRLASGIFPAAADAGHERNPRLAFLLRHG